MAAALPDTPTDVDDVLDLDRLAHDVARKTAMARRAAAVAQDAYNAYSDAADVAGVAEKTLEEAVAAYDRAARAVGLVAAVTDA